MGCKKRGHIHTWPTRGTLTIQRCEVRCNFCTGDAAFKDWKYAWFLRRHVRAIHVKKGKYKGMQVDAGWDDENPRDGSEARRSSGRVKIESLGSDADNGVPQIEGELEEGPMPDYITQSNFGNVGAETYNVLAKNLATRHANIGYDMQGISYGNPDAQIPTLAGEYPYGLDHAGITEEFHEFLNSTAGFDGNPEEEEEEVEDEAEDDNIVVAGRATGEDHDEKGESLIPLSSAGRFFMADATDPEPDFDAEDSMPLAERLDNYDSSSQAPTDQVHNNMLQMMFGFSETMQQSEIDPREMLPTMQQVMRTLHQEQHNGFPY